MEASGGNGAVQFHPLVEPSVDANAAVEGMAFAVSETELANADAYEVDYQRYAVRLRSGRDAWFYGAKAGPT
ncbi:MAG TPA: hypothetical protein VFF94_00875 [Novosphingobium sp.]|nr:hypothetical protein [Novosphingobium sp.]